MNETKYFEKVKKEIAQYKPNSRSRVKGTFASANILPGLELCAKSLSNNTSLLPNIELRPVDSIIAKNTIDCMNSGMVYGHADMIAGLIKRIENELGYDCKHILTGGGAVYIKDIVKDDFVFDRDLNLNGLNIIINKNSKEK